MRLLLAVPFATAATLSSRAEELPDHERNLAALESIFQTPEDKIDLAQVKLTIDQMIDPTVDVGETTNRIDTMVRDVASTLPAMATNSMKLEALRSFLYQPGPWNQNRPFRYDFDDPFGRRIENKLLRTYLNTRKGNCVSMPLLFIVLGQKLGLEVTAAAAPEHILVKFKVDTGQIINLEATDGAGPTQDASYQAQMQIEPAAIENGIYLRPLSRKETVVVMMSTLMEFYSQQGLEKERIAVAKLALAHDPRDVRAMLHLSSANYRMMKSQFIDHYPEPMDIPLERQAEFIELGKQINLWRSRAEALGWREPTQNADASYLETVKNAKAVQ